VVERAIRWSEGADGIAAEEVPFLVDFGTREDVGMCTDCIEPPRRAGFLDPDPHEVRWPDDLAPLGSRRSGVESILPWCVLAQGMKDRASRRWRESREGEFNDVTDTPLLRRVLLARSG